MSILDESELLRRCRRGEEDAWNELFEEHYIPAGRFVHQLSSDLTREDVDEICQETFLMVIRNILSFQGHCRFQTWLFRIAANKARDFLDRKNAGKRGGGKADISIHDDESGHAMMELPAPGPAPDAVAADRETLELLGRVLEQMGPNCREILDLRYFGGQRYEEIAAELGLNPKTVSSRLSKCMDRLQQLFLREKKRQDAV